MGRVTWSEFKLENSEPALTSTAQTHFYHNQFRDALSITSRFLDADPFNRGELLFIHIACLVELSLVNDLYSLSHNAPLPLPPFAPPNSFPLSWFVSKLICSW